MGEDNVLLVVKQLVTAIKYYNSEGIKYAGFSPDNILFDASGNVTIVDFEMAEYDTIMGNFDMEEPDTQFVAPEIISDYEYSEKSDVWALGVFIYY